MFKVFWMMFKIVGLFFFVFDIIFKFFDGQLCVLDSSAQNHAESSGNYFKNSVLDPKHAKFD